MKGIESGSILWLRFTLSLSSLNIFNWRGYRTIPSRWQISRVAVDWLSV